MLFNFDVSGLTFYLSAALIVFQLSVLLTNIIVQAVKGALWDKLPTNCTALIVAEALVLVSLFAGASIIHFSVTWYMVVAAVITGIIVAYAAMFGYDKLLSGLFDKLKELSGVSISGGNTEGKQE